MIGAAARSSWGLRIPSLADVGRERILGALSAEASNLPESKVIEGCNFCSVSHIANRETLDGANPRVRTQPGDQVYSWSDA